MKNWETVFKILANINRLEILKMMAGGKRMNVSDISDKLKISYKSTSQHLIILKNAGVLEDVSQYGHVFYCLSSKQPKNFQRALKLFI